MLQANGFNVPTLHNTRHTTTEGAFNRLAWFRLFQTSLSQEQRTTARPNTNRPSPDITLSPLPAVGGNYDFIVPQAWPTEVVRIDSNVFSASRPYPTITLPDYFDENCECEGSCVSNLGTHLTSSCINVNTATVCSSANCSLGHSCGNRFEPRFPLDLVESRVELGVVSSHRIPNGAFVVEYVGEILYVDDAIERPDRRYQAKFRTEAEWGGGTGVYVDSFGCGNESRFINHSCQPNCAMYEFNWTNTTRLGIFAIDDIPPLQELTFRYRRHNRHLFACQCGAHIAQRSPL